MQTAEIDGLIARVEGLTTADREVDALVARHVDGLNFGWCGEEGWLCGECGAHGPYCGKPLGLHDERRSYPLDWREDDRLPIYTASLDAVRALAERVLPGWHWGVSSAAIPDGHYPDGKPRYAEGFKAHFTKPSALRPMPNVAVHRDVVLALLLALLRAIRARRSE